MGSLAAGSMAGRAPTQLALSGTNLVVLWLLLRRRALIKLSLALPPCSPSCTPAGSSWCGAMHRAGWTPAARCGPRRTAGVARWWPTAGTSWAGERQFYYIEGDPVQVCLVALRMHGCACASRHLVALPLHPAPLRRTRLPPAHHYPQGRRAGLAGSAAAGAAGAGGIHRLPTVSMWPLQRVNSGSAAAECWCSRSYLCCWRAVLHAPVLHPSPHPCAVRRPMQGRRRRRAQDARPWVQRHSCRPAAVRADRRGRAHAGAALCEAGAGPPVAGQTAGWPHRIPPWRTAACFQKFHVRLRLRPGSSSAPPPCLTAALCSRTPLLSAGPGV